MVYEMMDLKLQDTRFDRLRVRSISIGTGSKNHDKCIYKPLGLEHVI